MFIFLHSLKLQSLLKSRYCLYRCILVFFPTRLSPMNGKEKVARTCGSVKKCQIDTQGCTKPVFIVLDNKHLKTIPGPLILDNLGTTFKKELIRSTPATLLAILPVVGNYVQAISHFCNWTRLVTGNNFSLSPETSLVWLIVCKVLSKEAEIWIGCCCWDVTFLTISGPIICPEVSVMGLVVLISSPEWV